MRRLSLSNINGGAVETFRLADGVSLYLDAVGALKDLPPNPRAVSLAKMCGYGDVPLFGDMFVGRFSENINVDMTVDDLNPDKPWLKAAELQNLSHQQDESRYRSGGMTAEEMSFKGGDGDGYTWSQTPQELEVSVILPESTRAKQCRVTFGRRKLEIEVVNGKHIIFDPLYGEIQTDGSMWTISDGNLVISLEKARENEVWPML